DPALYINRERSWLAFNERGGEEAADTSVPPLERVKFAAIASSNLDELFMVRVAGLIREIWEGDTSPDLAGLSPAQVLPLVRERARQLMRQLHQLIEGELRPALAKHGIRLQTWKELPAAEQARLTAYF